MFYKFYHLRWFHGGSDEKTPSQVRFLIDEAQRNPILKKDKAAALLVHLINGLGNIFGIYCDFVTEMIEDHFGFKFETNP